MKSRLYIAIVMHVRHAPVPHRFRYPVFTFAFDLDELPRLDREVRGFGYNRRALVSLHDRDYLRGEGTIRERLMRVLRDAGCDDGIARVELLTMPRMFGHVFNPVSFHYCYRADGSVRCILAEVNNTFGERHLYILREPEGAPDRFPLRFRHDKQFHVSPFNNMRGHYEFSLSDLGPSLRLVIDLVRDGGNVLTAVLWGNAVPLDSRTLRANVIRHPFRIVSNLPRIAWQACLLRYRRKLPFHHKPPPSSPMTAVTAPPSRLERLYMNGVLAFLERIRTGELTLRLPDGSLRRFGKAGTGRAETLLLRSYNFFRRVAKAGDVGFGESFVAGEWDCDDLTGLLRLLIANARTLDANALGRKSIARLADRWRHATKRNTSGGSRCNIEAHYDLSNEFFAEFLDPETLLYSCGIFRSPEESLAQAQMNKIHAMAELARLQAGDDVLEIGCGWGGFAIEAVRQTGCRVAGITLSTQQLELARRRVREAGLEDRIRLELRDYRDVQGRYDKIVSIEMLEAVGHEYYGAFFAACAAALKPGGRLVVQVITIPDDRYETYRRNPDWIQKHIFPGGQLPCLKALKNASRESGLVLEETISIGLHYAPTLKAWRERFVSAHDRLLALGFDNAQQRKWLYYFSYCEAGFASGYIDDCQLVFSQPAV